LIYCFAIFHFPSNNYNPEAYCPIGGIQALSGYFVSNSLACDMTTVQIVLGVLLVIVVLFIGKLFCSYICPIGFVTELLDKLRKYLNFKALEIKNRSVTDLLFRSIKYILLFVTFYFSISSSELFCKIIDPYYAVVTRFKGEMYIWVSTGIVFLLIFGSMFIKMFWCKYICPIGAMSNIFKYLYASMILILLFVGLNLAGVHMSWVILLIAFCAVGYLCELLFSSKVVFSLFKITRDKTRCIEGCSDCIKKCPYSIQINKVDKVKDIDCTLCSDCINECQYGALSINKRTKFHLFIPLVLIFIILAGIYFGKKLEMPTINLKWGNYKEKTLSTLDIDNLRSVKCYASSMNFAKKILETKGIYGVRTYINSHKVRIFYNKDEIADTNIKRQIYSPVKFKIKAPEKDTKLIKVYTLHTDNMQDPIDVNYLGMHFRKIGRKLYGLESYYSTPLSLKLYVDASENIDKNFLQREY
jgi:NAD-dependent dihydropyrimidine dehydrogenase PreA subunit